MGDQCYTQGERNIDFRRLRLQDIYCMPGEVKKPMTLLRPAT